MSCCPHLWTATIFTLPHLIVFLCVLYLLRIYYYVFAYITYSPLKTDTKQGLGPISEIRNSEPKSEVSRVMHRHPIFLEDLSRSCM